ncbi:hypothetical protein [Chryseobacterium sp. Marseille-Q8038]
MKKLLISTVLLLGLSMNVSAQKHPPVPPHPSKSELVNIKMQDLPKNIIQRKNSFLITLLLPSR